MRLPASYKEPAEKKGTVEEVACTTDVYGDGVTYEKHVNVYLPYCYRNVPIADNAAEMLKEMKTHSSSDYVFSSPTGGPISPDSVNIKTVSGILGRVRTPQNRSHCQMWQC